MTHTPHQHHEGMLREVLKAAMAPHATLMHSIETDLNRARHVGTSLIGKLLTAEGLDDILAGFVNGHAESKLMLAKIQAMTV